MEGNEGEREEMTIERAMDLMRNEKLKMEEHMKIICECDLCCTNDKSVVCDMYCDNERREHFNDVQKAYDIALECMDLSDMLYWRVKYIGDEK